MNKKRTIIYCHVCGKPFDFMIARLKYKVAKYCSPQCFTTYLASKRVNKTCKQCQVRFSILRCKALEKGMNRGRFCTDACYKQFQKTSGYRNGKKNPAYRNGFYIKSKRNTTSTKHEMACRRYKKEFLAKHAFPFCEVCKVNTNGTLRFEVHHIYYASRFPKHPNLHDSKNLIHLCIQCHNNFHAGRIPEKFEQLRKERGLIELFGS